MVDLVVVPANVQPGPGSIERTGTAAVPITAGDSVFIDSSGAIDLCENDQTIVEAACRGVALNDAAIGQPIRYVVSGEVDMGAITAAGQVYIVGAAPGGIAPEADAIAGEFVTIIGVGVSANNIKLGITQSGVAHA